MPRRHKLDQYPEARREAIRMYQEGKTLRQIAHEISIKYPVQVSKDSIRNLVKRYRDLLKMKEIGLLESEEDIDLFIHSQNLTALATGMLYELLAEWSEKGEIPQEKLDAILDILSSTSSLARTSASIERTKTQLIRHYEQLLLKIKTVIERNISDPEKIRAILTDLEKELA